MAQLTVATGTLFTAHVGLMQGRSVTGEDWDAFDTVFSNDEHVKVVPNHSEPRAKGLAGKMTKTLVGNTPPIKDRSRELP